MLLSTKTQNTLLWILAIVLLSGVSWFVIKQTIAMQKKIDRANDTIAMMKLEHEAAIVATQEANSSRRQIYEIAKERLCKAETALGNNSVFCDMPIPDDLRLLWQKPSPSETAHVQSTD